MQAFSLSLIKGRLGSDQERREIQTSPERKRARGRSSARPEGPGRRTPPPQRSVACVPGPDLTHPNRCAQGAVSCRRQRSLRGWECTTRFDGPPMRVEERTGRRTSPRPPRSRQAMVVGERTLVKAGLRPPPPAASALTRLRSPTSRSAQEIEGRERASSPSQHSPPRGAKKSPRPIDKKAPIRARP